MAEIACISILNVISYSYKFYVGQNPMLLMGICRYRGNTKHVPISIAEDVL